MLVARDRKAGRKSLFCAADFPTVADIFLIPQVNNANRFKCALNAFPRIAEIYGNAMQHPAFDAAQPAKQADAE
jgi:glutathione S-transferase